MRLNKKAGGAFDIQNNNSFIKARGSKITAQPFHQEQKELISKKIKGYTASKQRRLVATAVITLTVSGGLVLLASQLIKLL
ncbi:MAG: hypothetical protein HEP71_33240 [Roseivirga sp.]|nr:hypothetical protein [Roseivirga sp.]